jgi:DNA-directed RNA polymerase specialized sigma subunit
MEEESVLRIANKVASRYKNIQGVEAEDIRQAALLGVLEADARWTEDSGCMFSTMAYRYAMNEVNDLVYSKTTRKSRYLRIKRGKEIPQGLMFDEGESEDTSYSSKMVDEMLLIAQDRLTTEEYDMFRDLYEFGDRAAVANHMERTGVTQRKANRTKHHIREVMQRAYKDDSIN